MGAKVHIYRGGTFSLVLTLYPIVGHWLEAGKG